MSGIYIHVPFCSQACSYCNFHFSTSVKKKGDMVDAIIEEISLRGDGRTIKSIYFGGGTPSLLSIGELKRIMAAIAQHYDIKEVIECTLELNPEDAHLEYLSGLKAIGIHRLSMGIQSFFDEDLRPMNRVHTSKESHSAIERALSVGFSSLTVDLIYGVPWADRNHFRQNLDIIDNYGIPHLSAYALTVEEGTALSYQIAKGQQRQVDDAQSFEDFQLLQLWANKKSWSHYEISNLSEIGKEAVHNSNYWKGIPYLGFGPAAHGYENGKRSWNISNNIKYIKSIQDGILPTTHEELTEIDQFNEWIMTGLRLEKGLSKNGLLQWNEILQSAFQKEVENKVNAGVIKVDNDRFVLSQDQRFFADGHAADLFYIDAIGS